MSPNNFQDTIVYRQVNNESDPGNTAQLNLFINARIIHQLSIGATFDEVAKEDTKRALIRCQQEIAIIAHRVGWALSGIMEEGVK